MKQKLKRFMAGFMAMLTLVGTLFTNGTTAFSASPQANIAFWNASVKNSGEVSELKPGYNHGKILYSILDGNSAYCMNFGLRADGGYYNEQLEQLEEQLSTTFDTGSREQLGIKMTQTILDDNAFIFASHLKMSIVSGKGVSGLTAHPSDYYEITAELDMQ